ncbi:MAG: hypothetical protein HKN24_10770 [Acidimicrobiales bacterium]|nr:hypothetical protein [Acidimicrobiales bacterium]
MESEMDEALFSSAVAVEISASFPVISDIQGAAPADRPDLHGDLPALPGALGRGLAAVHDVRPPPSAQPLDLVACVQERFVRGEIRPDELPDPYRRYSAVRLVELWQDRHAPPDRSVCLVGAATIDRFLIDRGEVAGLVAPFGLVGDRHLDLAVLHHSIHDTLGPEAVFGFYQAYGSDPDLVRLDHHVLTSLLLGWLR